MIKNKETKTIGVKPIFAWIFSIFFIVGGIGTLVTAFLSGVFIILAGLIILPPFNKMLEDKVKLKLTTWLKVIIVLILLVFAGVAIPDGSSNNSNEGNGYNVNKVIADAQGEFEDEYIIEIKGGKYVSYSGSIGGGSNQRTVDGRTSGEDSPITYIVKGWPVVAVIQKQQGGGTLTVSILKGNEVINSETTTASYGIVTVSS